MEGRIGSNTDAKVTLYRVLAVLLGLIAVVLVGTHLGTVDDLGLEGQVRIVTGVVACS